MCSLYRFDYFDYDKNGTLAQDEIVRYERD